MSDAVPDAGSGIGRSMHSRYVKLPMHSRYVKLPTVFRAECADFAAAQLDRFLGSADKLSV